jgi:hypothetical protein
MGQAMVEAVGLNEQKRLDRGALQSFEQLAAGAAKMSPPRPKSPFAKAVEAAAPLEAPRTVVTPLQRSLEAPIQITDPCHRQATRLSPSQRLQLRRQEEGREREKRQA